MNCSSRTFYRLEARIVTHQTATVYNYYNFFNKNKQTETSHRVVKNQTKILMFWGNQFIFLAGWGQVPTFST